MKPMTLDEFDAILVSKLENAEMYTDDAFQVIRSIIDCFRNNRASLEAGMRGVLRFRKMQSHGNEGYVLIDLDGDPIYNFWYLHKMSLNNNAKEPCRKLARRLNLTAEFVEADDDD